jgi:DinB superfamily
MTLTPDDKDWTWVLERACVECGFDADSVVLGDLPEIVRANADSWSMVLTRRDVGARPRSDVWSGLEYACHVRDVNRIFAQRVTLMLTQDDPLFDNWDQDQTALEERYDLAEPATVEAELRATAAAVADTYAGVGAHQWGRSGRRSNGSVFTVDTIARYHVHDLVHHLHDVGFDPPAVTASRA